MAESRKEQAEATRNNLIEAAQSLFAEKGFKGASVRLISRTAGISESLLYHYFPNGKEDLFRAIAEANLKIMNMKLSSIYEGFDVDSIPLDDLIINGYKQALDIIYERMDVLKILIREQNVNCLVPHDEMKKLIQKPLSTLEALLVSRYNAGEIGKTDFGCAAKALFDNLISSVLVNVMGIGGDKDYYNALGEKLIRYHIDLWKRIR